MIVGPWGVDLGQTGRCERVRELVKPPPFAGLAGAVGYIFGVRRRFSRGRFMSTWCFFFSESQWDNLFQLLGCQTHRRVVHDIFLLKAVVCLPRLSPGCLVSEVRFGVLSGTLRTPQ